MPANITYDNGADTYTADYSKNFALIEKIAKQSLWQVKSTNPLSWIDKGKIGNGVAIEDAVLMLTESYDWDADTQDGSNLHAPSYPSFKVTYHSEWNGKQFKTTFSENQFKKVLLAGGGELDAASKIVSNLTESEGAEDYETSKALLTQGITVGNILQADTTVYDPGTTAFVIALKNIVDKMQFINTDYVAGGFKQRTPFDRIHIIMPYSTYNTMNVELLASLFNLEKAQLISKITLIDEGDKVYVVDQMGLLKYTRLYRMTNKFIEDGLYTNYWLTIDRMYGTSNLFKMCYISVSA